jgi:hypothetical protein
MKEEQTNPEARIPESITIADVTYKISETPELKSLISEVAKVEKSKLYSQIDALRKQIDDLRTVEVEPSSAPFDEKKLIEALKNSFVTKSDIESTVRAAINEAVKPIIDTDAERKAIELNEYREKLIRENLATCIPELVKGNTKEELESSLKESIRIRASYPSANTPTPTGGKVVDPLIQKQTLEQQIQAPTQHVVEPMVTESQISPIPRRQAPDVNAPAFPKRMTPEEFAKNRKALQEQLSSMYGQGQ